MIAPYKKRPDPPTVAMLFPDGTTQDENGRIIDLENFPDDNVRVWTSYDTARTLILDGKGEGLCWNREEIRWRHRRFEDDWKNRRSDVHVIKLPFPDDEKKAIRALSYWRDWLAENGASPVSTTGSAAWSLLRSCVRRPIYLYNGEPPPLIQTLGGRQELGPNGAGTYTGSIEQLDMPAAYATELGNLIYGGRWIKDSTFAAGSHPPEWWATGRKPVFCKATIKIPASLKYGPLPRRPKERMTGLKARLFGATFPVGCQMTDIWTWDEIVAAQEAGCKLIKIHETWGHVAGGEQPFLRWWVAIQEGRKMPGLAAHLAKMTGNALWGRFCMDGRYGARTIHNYQPGERHMRSRDLSKINGAFPDHALAETVSGRVRAELYRFMNLAGDRLLSAHTDGAWALEMGKDSPDGWRRKERAIRLDLLDPQVLRYWQTGSLEPTAVFAGQPAKRSLAAFEQAWELADVR